MLGTRATRSAPAAASGDGERGTRAHSCAQTHTEGSVPPQKPRRARPGENWYRWRTRVQAGTSGDAAARRCGVRVAAPSRRSSFSRAAARRRSPAPSAACCPPSAGRFRSPPARSGAQASRVMRRASSRGVGVAAVHYSPARRLADPTAAIVPFQPSYEDRPGAPIASSQPLTTRPTSGSSPPGARHSPGRERRPRTSSDRRRGHRLARPTRRRGRARGRARHRCVGRAGAAASGRPRLPPQPWPLRLATDRGAHRRALRRAPRRSLSRRSRLIIGAGRRRAPAPLASTNRAPAVAP